jgi:hypothetical protein
MSVGVLQSETTVNVISGLTGENRVAQMNHIKSNRMDKLEVIRARCGSALKRRLAEYAEGKELSESDVLRLALRDYLDRNAPAARSPARRPKTKGGRKDHASASN